ncbi:glutaminyl-tRNA synthetase [Deinobacterium chartae]|uniref:Glutamine--tRNA ligase n=1 Tax=Deinobacterium chartae TaxID=521158 RepID=A0A841HVC8_9DEIO|nr:glutamine--tRNA ligase/YqeY domain fusion protein [Deinobacterium chartae]MBB6096783.1 glutaminyl-tRNA synthetase [Deinobacterium chartae]
MSKPDHTPTREKRRVNPNFITDIIDRDLQSGRFSQVVTRFPPEPNGYMHIGHAFASFLDFATAEDYGGRAHLRLDDTNPEAESMEFANSIQEDMRWLGWDWGEHLYFASDYYEQLYAYAEELIRRGLAYVDSVSGEEMARLRGTVDQPGTPSPYRDRTPEENLALFRRMRAGEFENGAHVLRAKIDLASPNMKLRDPVLYRILHHDHYRTGKQWCIYPMYDFAHPISDAIEGITHSLCSLEFVDNRAIYDWLMDNLFGQPRPYQYEFGRRSLEYTVVSKRKLRKLVEGGFVSGWDDPRMPTIAAFRRRGVTPEAILNFAASIGVSRTNRTVDIALLEHAIRDDLNTRAPRVMAVVRPLRVVITNLGAEQTVTLPYWPHDVVSESPDGLVALPGGERVPPEQAVRPVPLTRELYIEHDDFSASPPPGFKRLTIGGKVRLRGAGVIRCDDVVTAPDGAVLELHCTLLPESESARGVIHWVSATRGLSAEFRLYDRLFKVPQPEAEAREQEDLEEPVETDFLDYLNPNSLEVTHGFVEPSVAAHPHDTRYQFERVGYFWRDPQDGRGEALVFNRIITLRDSWTKEPEKPARTERSKSEAAPAQVHVAVTLTPEQAAVRARLEAQGVGSGEAQVLARDEKLLAYLEAAATHGPIAPLAGWVVNELGGALREGENRVRPEELAALVALLEQGTISSRIAKDVLAEAQQSGEAPAAIVERKGLRVVSDTAALEAVIARVLAANPDKVAAYRGGRSGLLGFFTGQVMKETRGQADPQAVQELLGKALS